MTAARGARGGGGLPLTADGLVEASAGFKRMHPDLLRLHSADLCDEISPIVLDLADLIGADLDEIAARLRPRMRLPGPVDRVFEGAGNAGPEADCHADAQCRSRARAPVRLAGRAGSPGAGATCHFSVVGGRIEALAVVDGVTVQTCGDRASVLLADEQGIGAVTIGGTADLLAPAPLLLDRGYLIEAVDDDFAPARRLVTLRTGLRGHPWASPPFPTVSGKAS